MSNRKLKVISRKKLPELKPWLDAINDEVEVPEYIPSDPVSFLHAFDNRHDQLIAGFFAAIMAWGRRDIVLAKISDLLNRMDYKPYDFVRTFNESSAANLAGFKHRTFTETDVYWLVRCLQQILKEFDDFEAFWDYCYKKSSSIGLHLLDIFHDEFFARAPETPKRTRKHIANKSKKSSCKRLFLYMRWTVRKNSVVDLGIMNFMPPSEIMIPLDVHVARQARKLGLLSRKQNDSIAVQELTDRLLILNPADPSRYDYALFGLGVLNKDIPQEYLINAWYDE